MGGTLVEDYRISTVRCLKITFALPYIMNLTQKFISPANTNSPVLPPNPTQNNLIKPVLALNWSNKTTFKKIAMDKDLSSQRFVQIPCDNKPHLT